MNGVSDLLWQIGSFDVLPPKRVNKKACFVPVARRGTSRSLGHRLCVQHLEDGSSDGAFVVDGLDGIGRARVVCHGGGEYVCRGLL